METGMPRRVSRSVAAERLRSHPETETPGASEDLGDATHSDSADTDEMDVLNVIKIHSDSGVLI